MTCLIGALCIQSQNPIVTTSRTPNPHPNQEVVNPKTKKVERVFVDLEAVYPDINNPSLEMSFEELRAARRGWLNKDWSRQRKCPLEEVAANIQNGDTPEQEKSQDTVDAELSSQLQETLVLEDSSQQDMGTSQQKEGSREGRPGKNKKMRIREIRQETQTSEPESCCSSCGI
jgi:checkpoint serine/threonine-protein kinase